MNAKMMTIGYFILNVRISSKAVALSELMRWLCVF